MSPIPSGRMFQARIALVTRLPVVCPKAFTALLDQMENYFKGPSWDNDDALLDTFKADVVAVWARSNHLEVDWLIDRVSIVASFLHDDRHDTRPGKPPVDPSDPDMWRSFEFEDRDVRAQSEHRANGSYGVMIPSGGDELIPPRQPPAPWDQKPRRADSHFWERTLLPVLAWPDIESRNEFQKRALQHYRLRAFLAKNSGLTLYRKAPGLERHVAWLLQQRVLGMSLDSIADLAQQERDTRRRGDSATIEAGSISREIKKLEKLLPLPPR